MAPPVRAQHSRARDVLVTGCRMASRGFPCNHVASDALRRASVFLYGQLPSDVLVHIMRYLPPAPDRQAAAGVCKAWAVASLHPALMLWVQPHLPPPRDAVTRRLPVSGRGGVSVDLSGSLLAHTDDTFDLPLPGGRPFMFTSVAEAIAASLPGDTIFVAPGSYHDDLAQVRLPHHVRLLAGSRGACELAWLGHAQVSRPASTAASQNRHALVSPHRRFAYSILQPTAERAVVRWTGPLVVHNASFVSRGVTFTNVSRHAAGTLHALAGARVTLTDCVLGAPAAPGACLRVAAGALAQLFECRVVGGRRGVLVTGGRLLAARCIVADSRGAGIVVPSGAALVHRCRVDRHAGHGLVACAGAGLIATYNEFKGNHGDAPVVHTLPSCTRVYENSWPQPVAVPALFGSQALPAVAGSVAQTTAAPTAAPPVAPAAAPAAKAAVATAATAAASVPAVAPIPAPQPALATPNVPSWPAGAAASAVAGAPASGMPAAGLLPESTLAQLAGDVNDDGAGDGDFTIADEADDEATLEAEERGVSAAQRAAEEAAELAALQAEQDMPIEELMRMYGR